MLGRAALAILCFRVCLALLTDTFFQPDEFYQSLEIAHHAVFGYGYVTWEWAIERPVRSPVYPALYMAVYQLIKLLRLDDTRLLILAPKILNGVFAFVTDTSLCYLTKSLLGTQYVSVALTVSLTSFFHSLSLVRSLSNSAETALTTLAFSYFPYNSLVRDRTQLRKCICFAALACMMRPTNAIVWMFAFGSLIARSPFDNYTVGLLADLILVGTPSLIVLLLIDTWYYGKLTFTPLNFVLANVSVSSYYGVNRWSFYLVEALPLLTTTALPFVIHGAYLANSACDRAERTRYTTLFGVVAGTIAVYSFGPHKEWRFIHPLLPLLHVCAAKSLHDLAVRAPRTPTRSLPIRRSHIALLLLNVPAILYVLFFHGQAQVVVMHHLRSIPPAELDSVGFLMPCHSTPWQSHLHRPNLASTGKMWALTCEPPLNTSIERYEDQTDIFYKNVSAYLHKHFPATVDPAFPPAPCPMTKMSECTWQHEWPRVLVMFGALLNEPEIPLILQDKGYVQTWYGTNGFEEDARRRGGVVVWKWVK